MQPGVALFQNLLRDRARPIVRCDTGSATRHIIDPALTVARNSGATRVTSVGGRQEMAANTHRLDHAIGTSPVVNQIRNPRGEGAILNNRQSSAANITANLPVFWEWSNSAAGVTVIGQGVEDGIPYTDLLVEALNTFANGLEFEIAATNPPVQGATYIGAYYVRPLTPLPAGVEIQKAFIGAISASEPITFSPGTLKNNRHVISGVAGTGSGLRPRLRMANTSGATATYVLRVGAPQLYRANADPGLILLPAPGTPAFSGQRPALGVLVENVSTNHIRNPRAEGAVAGTPGTLPTGWFLVGSAPILSVVGAGVEEGDHYLDIRLSGSMSGMAGFLAMVGITTVPGSSGQTWTFGSAARLLSGTLGALNVSTTLRFRGTDGNNVQTFDVPVTLTANKQLLVSTGLCTNGAAAFVTGGLWFTGTGSTDATIRLYAGQLEQTQLPSSLILPAPGTLAATSRADDLLRVPAADLAAMDLTRGTILLRWRDRTNGENLGNTTLFTLGEDTTNPRRIAAFISGGTSDIQARAGSTGAGSFPASVGPVNRDPTFVNRYGMTWGTTRAAHTLNGQAVQSINTAVPMTQAQMTDGLRLFSRAPFLVPYPVQIEAAIIIPRMLSDAELLNFTIPQ